MSQNAPGSESLVYRPAKVSWATAQFIGLPPSFAGRVFLYAVVVFLAVAAVYASLAKTAISVEARGKLVTEEAVLPIRAPYGMTVAKLHVKENQRVAKGDLLVESEDRVTDEEYRLIESQTEALKKLVGQEKSNECPRCPERLRAFAEGAFKLENRGYIRDVLAEARQILLDYVATVESATSLSQSTMSIRRRIAVASSKLDEIRKRNAETILAMQVEALTNEIVQGQSELSDRKQAVETRLTQARSRLEVKLGTLLDTLGLYRTQNILRAPMGGVISGLTVSGAGHVVTQGQQLMEILPLDSGLVAELYVANKDISQVRAGLEARVKLDALPEREYGAVDGKVHSVAEGTLNDPKAPPAYRVTTKLARQSLTKGEVEYPFKTGMTLTAIIVTRYESLLVVGLKKVFNLKDELFDG